MNIKSPGTVKKILLVDDDEDDREFFILVLGNIDPSLICETAENGKIAIQVLEKNELPDIIFLDLNMPVMNGTQFLTQIKQHELFKHIPVIILSTSSDSASIAQAAQLGAMGFITKPNKLYLLEAHLREILF